MSTATRFSFRDHTALVNFAMHNTVQIMQKMGMRNLVRMRRPSVVQVLRAMLRVRGMNTRLKVFTRTMIRSVPIVERHINNLSPKQIRELNVIIRKLRAKKVPAMLSSLKSLRRTRRVSRIPKMKSAVNTAFQILNHGKKTIYSSDHPYHVMFATKTEEVIGDIATEDAVGAIKGLFTPVPGGALGGAVLGSLKSAISHTASALCAD